jgi:enamine deaminase RidA (YjgF/YER057c/UK114 family)
MFSQDKNVNQNKPVNPVIRGGDFLFMSSRCGRHNFETGERNTTIETQTVQCLKKIKKFMQESGACFEDVVQITVLLANSQDREAMEKAYQGYCQDHNFARIVIVTPLPSPDMLIQMGCIAYHPAR